MEFTKTNTIFLSYQSQKLELHSYKDPGTFFKSSEQFRLKKKKDLWPNNTNSSESKIDEVLILIYVCIN